MNRRLTPAEMDELLGAYALDAVDDDEREQIEQYLEENPRARAEVTEHREVAAMMSLVGGQAPDGLWDRIAGEIATDADGERGAGAADRGRRREAEARGGGRSRSARSPRPPSPCSASPSCTRASASTTSKRRRPDAVVVGAADAMTNPDARLTTLTTDDGTTMADVVVQPNGQGYLVPRSMPALASDRTYQMWGVIGAEVISLGVLGNDPTVSAFHTDPACRAS